jgi:hypothetical protein
LTGGLTDAVQNAIATMIKNWMDGHPFWAWLVSHPFWSLGLVFVVLVLLRGLLGAIAHFVEQVWVAILRSPLELSKWLLGLGAKSFQSLAIAEKREGDAKQQRLTEIVNRLEMLKQEQNELLQEVKTLLGSEQVKS